jgi:hypothetical protein
MANSATKPYLFTFSFTPTYMTLVQDGAYLSNFIQKNTSETPINDLEFVNYLSEGFIKRYEAHHCNNTFSFATDTTVNYKFIPSMFEFFLAGHCISFRQYINDDTNKKSGKNNKRKKKLGDKSLCMLL